MCIYLSVCVYSHSANICKCMDVDVRKSCVWMDGCGCVHVGMRRACLVYLCVVRMCLHSVVYI